MAILGRTYVPPIVASNQVADFATVRQPIDTVVVASPYAAAWFKGPQATTLRNPLPTTPAIATPAPLVLAPLVPTIRRQGAALVWFPRGTFVSPPPPVVESDVEWCAQEPVTGWLASGSFTDWEADTPVTNWMVTQPVEDC